MGAKQQIFTPSSICSPVYSCSPTQSVILCSVILIFSIIEASPTQDHRTEVGRWCRYFNDNMTDEHSIKYFHSDDDHDVTDNEDNSAADVDPHKSLHIQIVEEEIQAMCSNSKKEKALQPRCHLHPYNCAQLCHRPWLGYCHQHYGNNEINSRKCFF